MRAYNPRDFAWDSIVEDVPYRSRLADLTIVPAVTVEYLGRPIGVHFLDKMTGGDAEFWAHFLAADARGKGIGAISWFKACQYFFDNVSSLQNLLFRAPKGNLFAQRLLKKLPLKFSHGDSLYDTYTISRSEFSRLRNEESAGDEVDDELDDVE